MRRLHFPIPWPLLSLHLRPVACAAASPATAPWSESLLLGRAPRWQWVFSPYNSPSSCMAASSGTPTARLPKGWTPLTQPLMPCAVATAWDAKASCRRRTFARRGGIKSSRSGRRSSTSCRDGICTSGVSVDWPTALSTWRPRMFRAQLLATPLLCI